MKHPQLRTFSELLITSSFYPLKRHHSLMLSELLCDTAVVIKYRSFRRAMLKPWPGECWQQRIGQDFAYFCRPLLFALEGNKHRKVYREKTGFLFQIEAAHAHLYDNWLHMRCTLFANPGSLLCLIYRRQSLPGTGTYHLLEIVISGKTNVFIFQNQLGNLCKYWWKSWKWWFRLVAVWLSIENSLISTRT